MSHLLLSVMGAFAQFERDLIRERQREGLPWQRRGRELMSAASIRSVRLTLKNCADVSS